MTKECKVKSYLVQALLVIVVGLASALAICIVMFKNSRPVIPPDNRVIDTVTVVVRDTLIERHPTYITKKVVDTIRIKDTIYIERVQKRYFKDGAYDLWISGYEPNLDSIKVFPKIERIFITETAPISDNPRDWAVYAGGGVNFNHSSAYPQATLSLVAPGDAMFSANVGYYNGLVYGFTIQMKIK